MSFLAKPFAPEQLAEAVRELATLDPDGTRRGTASGAREQLEDGATLSRGQAIVAA